MIETLATQTHKPKFQPPNTLVVNFQPGHPDENTIDFFISQINSGRLDYLVFVGPGHATFSDLYPCDSTPIYNAALQQKLPMFWITDASIPPGQAPMQYERGVKFEYSNLPLEAGPGGVPFCAFLVSASAGNMPEVMQDLKLFHAEDSSTTFKKMVEKYGRRNEHAIALAKSRFASCELSFRQNDQGIIG